MSKYITVTYCGSEFVNHTHTNRLLVAVRKVKKPQSFKGTPQQTELLSILTTREVYGWTGRQLKLDLQVLCSKKFGPA